MQRLQLSVYKRLSAAAELDKRNEDKNNQDDIGAQGGETGGSGGDEVSCALLPAEAADDAVKTDEILKGKIQSHRQA